MRKGRKEWRKEEDEVGSNRGQIVTLQYTYMWKGGELNPSETTPNFLGTSYVGVFFSWPISGRNKKRFVCIKTVGSMERRSLFAVNIFRLVRTPTVEYSCSRNVVYTFNLQ